jgi:hypothetical protein
MKKHVELIGILYIALHCVLLLVGIGIFIIFAGIGAMAASFTVTEGIFTSSLFTIIGFCAGVLFLLFSLPGIIAGIGLLKRRPWARMFTLILSAFNLINIPLGTALAIYSFWVLMQDETIAMFKSE